MGTKKAEVKPLFEGKLRMTAINKDYIKFEVIPEEGTAVLPGFSEIAIDRSKMVKGKKVLVFPVDDNFNFAFMDAKIQESEDTPNEVIDEIRERQKEFNRYRKLKLVIR